LDIDYLLDVEHWLLVIIHLSTLNFDRYYLTLYTVLVKIINVYI